MKRSLGLLSIGAIAVAGMVALSIQAGCASDEDPAEDGAGGNTAGSGGATGGTGGGNEGGTGGGTGGTAGGTGGTGGGSSCPVGQVATIADIANGTVGTKIQVQVTGAIATTKKMVVYFSKSKGSCLWGVFVKDPNADRGMMVIDYGDNAPENTSLAECPVGTDAIPEGVVPGDILDITGETDAYAPSDCSNVNKQTQIQACAVAKTGSGAAPEPVVVTNLDGLATGMAEYQGLLVRIENVTAENYDGGAVGPYGVIELEGTELQINDNFYYTQNGAPEFDPSQQFNYVVGINHLSYCDWVLQPRDKCTDFDPASKDCL